MLQLLALVKCTRLSNHVFFKSVSNGYVRYMSKKSDIPTGDKKCTKQPEPVKSDSKKNEPKKTETEVKGKSEAKNEPSSEKSKEPKTSNCAKTNSGGSSRRPPSASQAAKWKRITLTGALPLVAVLAFVVLTSQYEQERPEFKPYPYMYQRTKPFFWGDGNHGRFHNSYWNAIPPDGYEDEIDAEAAGKTPETDAERTARLKEFAEIRKEWKKKTGH